MANAVSKNVNCGNCGQNIAFYQGDLKRIRCKDCKPGKKKSSKMSQQKSETQSQTKSADSEIQGNA